MRSTTLAIEKIKKAKSQTEVSIAVDEALENANYPVKEYLGSTYEEMLEEAEEKEFSSEIIEILSVGIDKWYELGR